MVAIVADRCTGCGLCALVCPSEALKVRGRAELLPERCTGCLVCVKWCPVDALREVE